MSKTALVTGAGGFVSHHVIEYLLEKTDWKIVGIDSFRHKGDSLRLAHLKSNPRLTVITHDLNTPISPRIQKQIGEINYILNIASNSHVDRSIEDPVPFVLNNVNLALNMGEFARLVKPEVFLQMSTDEVFGPAIDGYTHKEWDCHKPSNPYSASKAAQENILYSYWRCYGVPVIRTCTMNIFGLRQDAEKFVPLVIKKLLNDEVITVHGSKDQVGTRMYLHAFNLADAWLYLLKNTKPTAYVDDHTRDQWLDAYNIAGLEEVSNLDMVNKIGKILGKTPKVEFLDFHSARAGHDRRYALDSSKITALGWKAPVSFEKSLEDTVLWYLKDENKIWL